MSKRRKITIKSVTTKTEFQDILQGKFQEIYTEIQKKFNIDKDSKIKYSSVDGIKKYVETLLFPKIGDIFTNKKNNIQYKFSIKCENYQLGKLNSSHNITVSNDYPDLMIFRDHNPLESNILRAIFYNLSDSEFLAENEKFNIWLKTQASIDYDSTIKTINTFTNEETTDNKVKLFAILDILSNYTDTNIILFSQTFKKLNSDAKTKGGVWFSSEKILSNINVNEKPLSIIFLISNSTKVIFEPVIVIDITNKFIIKSIESNFKQSVTDINNNFYKHLLFLITNKKVINLENTKQSTIIQNKMKLDNLSEIYFNPYDKDVELPIIELELNSLKKEYLIGSLYGKFRNIYSKSENNLVGKVILNGDTNTLDVYWCDGYPK